MSGFFCYHCANSLSASDFGRQESCGKCMRDTRCCKNCEHYDRNYNNECKEEQAGRQVEKEKGNFCEWFKIKTGAPSVGVVSTGKDLKSAAEALFKKK